MDALKKYFPHAFTAKDVKSFIIALIIYAVIAFIGGIVIGLLSALPIVGIVFGIIGWLLEIYITVGVVLSILVFVKVIK